MPLSMVSGLTSLMHCTSQRSRRTSSCRVARLFRDVADSLFSIGGAAVSSSSIPQVAVEFMLYLPASFWAFQAECSGASYTPECLATDRFCDGRAVACD